MSALLFVAVSLLSYNPIHAQPAPPVLILQRRLPFNRLLTWRNIAKAWLS